MINKQIKEKLNTYFIQKLGMYEYRNGWLKGDCPDCGEHKFGVHLGMERSNCFKCGYQPRLMQLVIDVEKLKEYRMVYEVLNDLSGTKYHEEEYDRNDYVFKDAVLPEGYRNIKDGKSVIAKAARRYLRKRGFDIDELSQAGFGYGTCEKYFGYIIIPYYDNNKLIYFTTRLYIGSGPKFNNPPIEDFNVGKSSVIYNKDALYMYDRTFVVESVTNSRTLGDNAIAVGGKKLSSYQLNEIIKSPCTKIIIGLDRDAIEQAIDLAFELIDYKKVKIMVMPEGKDINDVGKARAINISHKAHYLTYAKLQRIKNKFKNENTI